MGCLVDGVTGTVYVVVAALVRPDQDELTKQTTQLQLSAVAEALATLKPSERPELWVMVPASHEAAAAAAFTEHVVRWGGFPG